MRVSIISSNRKCSKIYAFSNDYTNRFLDQRNPSNYFASTKYQPLAEKYPATF